MNGDRVSYPHYFDLVCKYYNLIINGDNQQGEGICLQVNKEVI